MIQLQDPVARAPWYDKVEKWLGPFAKDSRDLPFVALTFSALLVLVPFAVVLFLDVGFSPWLGIAYLAVLLGGFVDKYTLMLHCTSHRRLFAKRFSALNQLIPLGLAPFMGQTPYTYYAHHIGMHHTENNLTPDLSSTLRFDRDSLRGFLRYFGRFFCFGIVELAQYHYQRGHTKLFRRAVLGELGWYAGVIALAYLNFAAALVVFIIPLVLIRFLMMAGNWAQHAFVAADEPANPYRNSLTCINTRYNRRCYNDGYHAGHHVKANRHWTEMPGDFERNLATYRDEGAVVFEGIDYTQIWALLMFKRYRTLARHFVELRQTPRTEAEIIVFLRGRTRRIGPTPVKTAERVVAGVPAGAST